MKDSEFYLRPKEELLIAAKLSSFIWPMSTTLSDDRAFDDPKWLFEIKWHGYRAISELNGKDTRFYSRNGLSYKNYKTYAVL